MDQARKWGDLFFPTGDVMPAENKWLFSENFVLPISHDEVVHGKGSMLNKMPGDEWQRFANLRLLYTYMYTYPGKKLLFMGCEFGQRREWSESGELDWPSLDHPLHQGVKDLAADLNRLYTTSPALYYHEFDYRGFEWIDCHDSENSVLSFLRRYEDQIPFHSLLKQINETHRRGLDVETEA